MKVKMVIETRKAEESGNNRSQIWEGELDIIDQNEYLMLISVIAEGKNEPICQVPFSTGTGHYLWIPPDNGINAVLGEMDDETF